MSDPLKVALIQLYTDVSNLPSLLNDVLVRNFCSVQHSDRFKRSKGFVALLLLFHHTSFISLSHFVRKL